MTTFKCGRDLVTKLRQQRVQFVVTAVNVADNVEWAMIELAVVPERLALDDDGVDFFRGREFVNVTEAFAFEIADRTSQLLTLLANDVRAEVAIRALAIAILSEAIGQVEHERDGKDVIVACELNERLACFWLDVGGVDDG